MNTSKKGKRKDPLENGKTIIMSERERLLTIIDLMRHLKNGLQVLFDSIGIIFINIYFFQLFLELFIQVILSTQIFQQTFPI